MATNKSLISESSGIVDAAFQQVSDLLFNIQPGKVTGGQIPFILQEFNQPAGKVTLDIRGGPDKFTVYSTGAHEGRLAYMEVIPKEAIIAIYGGYWYRGEYQLQPHERGCQISLTVYNIAPGFTKLFVPFLKEYRQIVKASRTHSKNSSFALFLQNIEAFLRR